jgi:hypothetical protein
VKVRNLPRDPKQYDALTVIARGGPDTSAVEVSLVQKDGNAFGTNIPLWPTWGETSVPISQLRPMWKTRTQKPDLSQLDHVAIIFGAWLFDDVRERSHAVEIQSVQLTRKPELWTISVAAKDEPLALVEPALRRVKTHGHEAVVSRVRGMDPGKSALRVSVKGFGAQPPPAGLRAGDCTSFRLSISPETSCCREEMAEGRFIVVKARAGQPATNRLEMVLIESDGSPWGAVVPLTEKWQTIKIPVGELRYFAHWRPAAAGRGGVGDHLHPANIEAVNICFGAWLYGEQAGNPHAIEIQEIVLAKE